MTQSTRVVISSKTENFEDILNRIGGVGRAQTIILTIVLSFEIPTAMIGFIPVLTGNIPEDWTCDGNPISKMDVCFCNGTLDAFRPYTSIVGEWGLICEFAWISDLINSIQMVGMMVGGIASSQFADWYGRKYAVLGSGMVLGLGSIVSAVAPNPYVYTAGRLMAGAGFSSILSLTGIYAMEFLPAAKRALSACTGPFGWGLMIVGLMAYFVRPWRTLAWISTSPLLVVCPLLLLVPESPRFLIRQGRFEEAERVLNSIAKFNGLDSIDGELLKEIAEREQMGPMENSEGKVTRASYLDLFRRDDLRVKTVCFCLIWFSWALVYFGVYFNIKNVPGNIFLNVVYMGLADAIGYPVTLLVMDRYGRRKSLVMTMSLSAIFMVILAILQIFLELSAWPAIILISCTLGRFFLAMSRSAVKCFTAESYPTDIRSIGGGFCGLASALGAAVCPQIVFIGSIAPSVPFFVFAAVGVSGSFFSYFMPETSGKPLQESIIRKMSKRLSIISAVIMGKRASGGGGGGGGTNK